MGARWEGWGDLKGLLRTLRHVKSPLVCAAAVRIISVFSESLAEAKDAIAALSCLFKDLLDRRKIGKQILGSEMEDEYILPTEYCGVTARGAQGERQQADGDGGIVICAHRARTASRWEL